MQQPMHWAAYTFRVVVARGVLVGVAWVAVVADLEMVDAILRAVSVDCGPQRRDEPDAAAQ